MYVFMRAVQYLLIVVFLFQLPFGLLGQDNGVLLKSSISGEEVVEGSRIEVTYQLSGSINGDFRAPDFKPFQRVGGIQELSGMQFVNGVVNAHHTWVLGLIAPVAGEYTIPAGEVVLKGKVYRSKELRVRVLPASESKSNIVSRVPAGADPNIFLIAEASRSSVYVGQQVVLTVRLYTKVSLSGVNLVGLPGLSKGVLKELERYSGSEDVVVIAGNRYSRLVVYAGTFFAEEPGRVLISQAVVNTAIMSGNAFSSFRSLQVSSRPVVVEVKPLPLPVPEGFSGLVGRYEAEIKVFPDSILRGEASVCNFVISGNGNSRMFLPPVALISAGLAGYEPIVKEEAVYENGQELVHRQTLEYTFSAKDEGDQTIKPVLVWFDPDSSKYCTYGEVITIRVGAEKGNTFIQRDVYDKSFWNKSRRLGLGAILFAAVLLIVYFVVRRYRYRTLHPAYNGKLIADNVVKGEEVNFTINEEYGTNAFYEAVYWEIRRFFSSRLGVEVEQVNSNNLGEWMKENGYGLGAIEDMRYVFRTCEQALYAEQDHSREGRLVWGKATSLTKGIPY